MITNDERSGKEKELIKKELEEIAPKLAAMNKTNPFGLPENYFSNLEHRVMQQVKPVRSTTPEPERKGSRINEWWSNLSVILSGRVMATTVASVLVLSVSLFFLHSALSSAGNRSTESGLEFSGLTNEELGSYVINHSDEFDLGDIDPETLNNIAQNYKVNKISPEPANPSAKPTIDDSDKSQTDDDQVL